MRNIKMLIEFGCGRTDAGVHALNYTANFHTNSNMATEKMYDYLYKYLPDDIQVKSIKDCSERFHSRYNALNKTYLYKIYNSNYRNIFSRRFEYNAIEPLDIDKMLEASKFLVGTHDFQSFTTLKSKKKSTIKTIYSIDILKKGNNIDIEINGNSFLWHMVRIIVGTLLEVGKGNIIPTDIERILNERKRQEAGPNAPAHGLFLKRLNINNKFREVFFYESITY
ncbi:tRNA pseudouridine(38-40) synthase TruA [Sedimentibacter sp. zth1]|uniref:tRNA pseudouridine(38-40) synthase TruA n=1 Tax=Sedimentibacter sp. zth1 TaxID=2816908 RepID=UPI001A9256C8|nr:tRNA pseudouridine(38-40) synthase TruA [Sedimentibacter sp. zth1]QSX05517.1 tRNA pseudouridine(38-40) synthase TruA [Sedimentibacter sp. zth1]